MKNLLWSLKQERRVIFFFFPAWSRDKEDEINNFYFLIICKHVLLYCFLRFSSQFLSFCVSAATTT